MRLSTKGRVAVTALIDIALREDFGPVRLTDVATRQQISLSYLEQLFSKLRLQGLVASTRGPHGGYVLGRRVEDITVTDIIIAVDDALPKAKQNDAAPEQDIATILWDTMSTKILNFTQTVTLKSLVVNHQAIDAKMRQMPSLGQSLLKTVDVTTNHPNFPIPVAPLGQSLQTN
jgi:Rrf2 family iron-sulfur cluster assembly transcriptional regulator